MVKVIVDEALETSLDESPLCLSSCGTKHRGCDPQCPKRWFEEGKKKVEKRWEEWVKAAEEHFGHSLDLSESG